MFEGKLPRPAEPRPLDEQGEGESLHSLSWDGLVARLAAARDLRTAFGANEGAGEGSFDASCARRIAAHHNGKQVINLDDSSNGKGPAGTADAAVNAAGGAPFPAPRGSK